MQSGYARPGKRMDLAQKVHFLTLDSISTIGFDQCFGLLDQDADPNSYTTSTMEGLRAINRQMALGTWWTNWIPLVGPKSKNISVASVLEATGRGMFRSSFTPEQPLGLWLNIHEEAIANCRCYL